MPMAPETRDRLTSAVSQLVRIGRHVGSRAAGQIYGDLPSFGWALLVPLQRDGDQRISDLAAHAGVDASVASRQLAVLERAGYVAAAPRPPRRAGQPAPHHARRRRGPRHRPASARTGRCRPSPAGTRPTPDSSATCSTAWSPT